MEFNAIIRRLNKKFPLGLKEIYESRERLMYSWFMKNCNISFSKKYSYVCKHKHKHKRRSLKLWPQNYAWDFNKHELFVSLLIIFTRHHREEDLRNVCVNGSAQRWVLLTWSLRRDRKILQIHAFNLFHRFDNKTYWKMFEDIKRNFPFLNFKKNQQALRMWL